MSDKEAVDIELAKERLELRKENVHSAGIGVPGFRARDVIASAETQAVMDILVRAGICTAPDYLDTISENIDAALQELVDAGLINAEVVMDEEEPEIVEA